MDGEDEGGKLINNSRDKPIFPKDSIIKRDLIHLTESFKYLNDKEYIDLIPAFQVTNQSKDQICAIAPIPLEVDWGYMHSYLNTWSEIMLNDQTKTKTNNWRRTHY